MLFSGILSAQETLDVEGSEEVKSTLNELRKNKNIDIDVTYYSGKTDQNGLEQGKWTYYADSEKTKLTYECNYINGKINGEAFWYGGNSKIIRAKEIWENDKLIFWTKYYHRNEKRFEIESNTGIEGTLAGQILWLGNNSFRLGMEAMNYGGDVYATELEILDVFNEIINESTSEKTKLTFWSFEEKLDQERFFENGKETKKIIYKYSFGDLSKKEIYTNGNLSKVILIDQMNKGKIKVTSYYDNGEVNEIGSLIEEENIKLGFWSGYHTNGKKKYAGAYKKGLKDGTWKFWNDKGKLEKVEKYKDGVIKN